MGKKSTDENMLEVEKEEEPRMDVSREPEEVEEKEGAEEEDTEAEKDE